MSFKVDSVSSIFKMCNGKNSQCLIFHCAQNFIKKKKSKPKARWLLENIKVFTHIQKSKFLTNNSVNHSCSSSQLRVLRKISSLLKEKKTKSKLVPNNKAFAVKFLASPFGKMMFEFYFLLFTITKSFQSFKYPSHFRDRGSDQW